MSERLFLTRAVTMGAAGLCCAAYAVLALLTGAPNPMPFWVPALLGVVVFAAMGTLTAATYLLGSVLLDARGRA